MTSQSQSQSQKTEKSQKMEESQIREDLASVTFRWNVDNFSELNLKHYSEVFITGDFKWYLTIFEYLLLFDMLKSFILCNLL